MTAPVEIRRDNFGTVALTTRQAVDLARYLTPEGEHHPPGMAVMLALRAEGESPDYTLARWIVRWGMVADAAEKVVDARGAAISAGNWSSGAPMRALEGAEAVLAARVMVARLGFAQDDSGPIAPEQAP